MQEVGRKSREKKQKSNSPKNKCDTPVFLEPKSQTWT